MKRNYLGLFLVITVFVAASGLVLAADSATQIVTFEVLPVNDISVSNNPAPLRTIPGSSVSDTSTTYSISANGATKKITGQLDADMPPGTTLQINLEAPIGAASAGDVTLSLSAADLVTGIANGSWSDLQITYTFTVDPGTDPTAEDTRTVTLTITDK